MRIPPHVVELHNSYSYHINSYHIKPRTITLYFRVRPKMRVTFVKTRQDFIFYEDSSSSYFHWRMAGRRETLRLAVSAAGSSGLTAIHYRRGQSISGDVQLL